MIAVDTNILVYAHRMDSSFYKSADKRLTELVQSEKPWAIPWACLHEFLAIVTHPKIYRTPTPLKDALEQVACWLEAPSLHLLHEGDGYWQIFCETLAASRLAGPRIHDVRIAAMCRFHGVSTLWTADRDFTRITGLTLKNPLV